MHRTVAVHSSRYSLNLALLTSALVSSALVISTLVISTTWTTPALAGEPSTAAQGQGASDEQADTAEQAGDEAKLEKARMHFKNGVELLQGDAPNYQDAYRQFELARELSGSWKVLGNLGFCALKLERDGPALEFYREYLAQGGDEIDPQEREHIEREILLIQGNMVHVTLEASEPNVRVSVVRVGSSAPPQLYTLEDGALTLGLRSGTLEIAAKGTEKTLKWEVTLSPEEESSHTFDFAAVDEPAPVASVAATPSEPTKTKPTALRIAGYVTAGVGIGVLGGGLATGLISQSKEKNAEEECIGSTCPASAKKDFQSAKDMATVANILFISGGVLTATGITLVIVGGNQPATGPEDSALLQPHNRLELGPLVTAGGGGLTAFGHF